MKRKFKKSLAIIFTVLTALVLFGCDAGINYYSYSDDNYVYRLIEVRTNLTLLDKIEDSAAVGKGKKWTLESYLSEFARLSGFVYEGRDDTATDCFLTFSTKEPIVDSGEGGGDSQSEIKKNPFFYTVTVTTNNPFNGLKEEYDLANGYQNATLMQRLKNGIGVISDGVYIEYLPSVTKAFPALKDADPSDIKLDFYWAPGTKRMRTSGEKVVIDGKTFFCFSRNFDKANEVIQYRYFRPNSIGWNITALIVGGGVVLTIILATKKKKQKSQLIERFPYDPEDRGGGSSNNLPKNR